MELHDILLKWLQTFELKTPHNKIADLSDGVALSEALNQIAPEWFTGDWVRSKIKPDTIGNWRIKVSNLKKILEKVEDYYQEVFNQNLLGFLKPELVKIAEASDPLETGRLLQLILGCAVNCNNKQLYIGQIMAMGESEQRAMMECIQELDSGGALSFSASLNLEPQLENLLAQLNAANISRDQLSQRVMELELQVTTLQEEKAGLMDEKSRLLNQMESNADTGSGTLRRQLASLKEELFKMESSRDDYRLKLESLGKDFCDMKIRMEELGKAAGEARALKDEVDVLRETAERVEKSESMLQLYKKKLEESQDAKRELKALEAKNLAIYKHNIELEEEIKRLTGFKSQVDLYKKEMEELRERVEEEARRGDRFEIEVESLRDQLEALKRERERLITERDSLKESNEELKCLQVQSSSAMLEGVNPIISDDLMSETETDLRQRIVRLEHENKLLREEIDKKGNELGKGRDLKIGERLGEEGMLTDLKKQLERVRKENREANQKIIQLESKLKEENIDSALKNKLVDFQQQLAREKQRSRMELEEKDLLLEERNRELVTIQERLSVREAELQEAEDKHKKYLEKAKSVVKAIDPNCLNGVGGGGGGGSQQNEVSLSLFLENQREVKALQEKIEAQKREEDLVATAFHNLASVKHREAVEQRLSTLSAGQSFLSQQRLPASRKVNTYNSK